MFILLDINKLMLLSVVQESKAVSKTDIRTWHFHVHGLQAWKKEKF